MGRSVTSLQIRVLLQLLVGLTKGKLELVSEISCWMWTGERQSTKMRIKYLEAALNQDIEYFDTEVRTSDVVYAINTDAVMVQDAISEKVKPKFQSFIQLILLFSFLGCSFF